MPDIQAFRALRYDLGHVGSLSDVIAPPYDVIGPELQDQLYKKHPANVIRLILNRDEPGDQQNDKYSRAAKFLKGWQAEGVLFRESDPALYVYHQKFDYAGRTYNRRGFMARVRLQRFGEGNIYPHEETLPGPKLDRLLLTRATKTNLSQIFGLYPDPQSQVQELLEEAIVGQTPLEAVDHLDVVHRLWPVSKVETISKVAGLIGPRAVFIADGHHRYETACTYRDELAAEGNLDAQHPANFVLMMCIGMSDPGLIVLPTHRLFRGLPDLDSGALRQRLSECFDTKVAGEGADLATTVWQEIETRGDQGTVGLYCRQDERWVVASLNDAGRARMAQVASDHSQDWQGLGVAVLHRLLVHILLGAPENMPKPKYVHLVSEVVEGLETGEFPLAALVMPATVDHIRSISEHHERMPAKSTYFYPKLLSGLVFNPLT